MLNKNKLAVIGSGFAGLSSAAILAQHGYDVHVFEKNEQVGGRARQFSEQGFLFDMGPSWYWMPDVFEKFYNLFGRTTSDFYELKKLDPGFQVIYGREDAIKIPASWEELQALFESEEPGSAAKLRRFMDEAAYKYEVGINDLVYKPGLSILELMDTRLISGVFKLQVFSSFRKHVHGYFNNPRLRALMEFPVLFLGAMPSDTPALYSLMNYAGMKQGTFYPMGGFGKVVDAFRSIAVDQGAHIYTNEPVQGIEVRNNRATYLSANGHSMEIDGVIGAADYNHIENKLIQSRFRNYSESYWDKRVFAPSCLLFYLGIDRKIDKLEHHNLFFDEDLDAHALEIYKNPKWPEKPLFYVCAPSKTDPEVAPEGKENLFLLMPIAPGLTDHGSLREKYFQLIMDRLEAFTGMPIRKHIEYKKSYCVEDFVHDYNAYKGNAYGLANTLRQTANLKPSLRNKKIRNLYYAGQLTVPGPGVPPSIISGQVAAEQLHKQLKTS
ncbi:MAG: phytoene desaturase [Flavobacteriales bacterium]|nr:phytoene desaturase [Flavobacteriales bacterium]